jgi:hypothetical protein
MADQPEALRLANELGGVSDPLADEAAAELRRLHAENERLHEMNQELIKAYNKMRNSAAGYGNYCEDSAGTRRCERDYLAAEDMFRAAIAKAEEQK